jgi:hypothetical protein
MPLIGALGLVVASLVALLGLPLAALFLFRRYRSTDRRVFLWLTAFVTLLAAAPVLVPLVSYGWRDHLCTTSGGWSFTSEADRQLMISADARPNTFSFSNYRISHEQRDMHFLVTEHTLRISETAGRQIAARNPYWSGLTHASGLLWLGRPDSEICNRKSYDDKLAHEHFASRVPK